MIRRVLAGIVGALALGLMPGQALAADSGEFRWGYQDHYRCVWHCEVRGRFFRPPAGPTPKPTKVPKPSAKTPLKSPVTVSSIGPTAGSKTGQATESTTGPTTAPTTSSSADPCIGLGFFSQIYCSVFGARPTWASAPPAAGTGQTPAATGTRTSGTGVSRHYGWPWSDRWIWDDCRLRGGRGYWPDDWYWPDWCDDGWYPRPPSWPGGWYPRPPSWHDRGRDSGGGGYNSHRHHPRGRDF